MASPTTDQQLWILLAQRQQDSAKTLDKARESMSLAYEKAIDILEEYEANDCGGTLLRRTQFKRTRHLLLVAVFATLSFFSAFFFGAGLLCLEAKWKVCTDIAGGRGNLFTFTVVCGIDAFGLLVACLVYWLFTCNKGHAKIDSMNIDAFETEIALSRRLYSNPTKTFEERFYHNRSCIGSMLNVPCDYPPLDRLIKESPMLVMFYATDYHTVWNSMNQSDFNHYLTALLLLALIEWSNPEEKRQNLFSSTSA